LFLKELDFEKPNIILIYMPEHGVVQTNKLIEYLQQKNIDPILLLADAAFVNLFNSKIIERIDGIVFAGGPNISETAERMKQEFRLLDIAIAHQIPVLGICRGHQMIGHRFGAEVSAIPHKHQTDEIIVKSKAAKGEAESKLYIRLDQKYKKMEHEKKHANSKKYDIVNLIKDDKKQSYTYAPTCLHDQHIMFKKNKRDKKHIRIVARAKDKTIEAMEIGEHIMSFQHHHEAKFKTDLIAKTLLNQYKNMVLAHHTKRTSKPYKKTSV